jgi:UDP-N-acetylglucosamine/UDP-N-acetylgalactosamine diphosphorylase
MSSQTHNQAFHALQQGKVAAVILAGGQGTRLGSNHPKGCYPISRIQKKSLFQLAIEKTKAASSIYKQDLEIAFMTSPENDLATKAYLKEKQFFELPENRLHFFCQTTLPLTDEHKVPLYSSENTPLLAPDGNGSFFCNLVKSPIFSRWKSKGVEYVLVTVIDNPLSDPFDEELVLQHIQENNDVTMRVIERQNPQESVGVVMQNDSSVKVVEYSELTPCDKEARDSQGKLLFRYANISYFCFSLSFIEKVGHIPLEKFPLHTAKKKPQGFSFSVLKSEYFIFDALPYSNKTGLLASQRELFFAPVKNKEGVDSPTTCQTALLARDQKQYQKITGIQVASDLIFELSMNFYYPTPEFLAKWQNKALPPAEYID